MFKMFKLFKRHAHTFELYVMDYVILDMCACGHERTRWVTLNGHTIKVEV